MAFIHDIAAPAIVAELQALIGHATALGPQLFPLVGQLQVQVDALTSGAVALEIPPSGNGSNTTPHPWVVDVLKTCCESVLPNVLYHSAQTANQESQGYQDLSPNAYGTCIRCASVVLLLVGHRLSPITALIGDQDQLLVGEYISIHIASAFDYLLRLCAIGYHSETKRLEQLVQGTQAQSSTGEGESQLGGQEQNPEVLQLKQQIREKQLLAQLLWRLYGFLSATPSDIEEDNDDPNLHVYVTASFDASGEPGEGQEIAAAPSRRQRSNRPNIYDASNFLELVNHDIDFAVLLAKCLMEVEPDVIVALSELWQPEKNLTAVKMLMAQLTGNVGEDGDGEDVFMSISGL